VAAVLRDFLRAEPDGLSASGTLGSHLCALLPELGSTPESSDRETLFAAICGAFETIGGRGLTAVFLDDLQWADAATLELLPSLAAAADEWPLVVLGAYRSEDISRGHPLRRLRTELRRAGRLAELVVEPLDAATTTVLAGQVLGEEPGLTLRAALYDRTQGVPFFVEELATALKDSSLLVSAGDGLELEPNATVPIPETVRDAVRLHAEGVSEAGHSSLEAAAVVGPQVELELLVALGEDAGIGELLERSLLTEVEPGIAAFRHDLAREALYADTPWPRRRTLHRALGDLLQNRSAEPHLVAEHWLAAGDPARARPLLLEAASRFCEVHAYRDAAAVGRQALELWPEGEDETARLGALDQLGRCAELSGETAEAARAWEEVAAGLVDPADLRRMAEVKQRLASVYQQQDAREKAVNAHTDAAEAFAECGLDAEAAGEWLVASEWALREDPAGVEVMVERALASARQAGRADIESRCLGWQGFIAGINHGRIDEGIELTRRALSLALGGDHVNAALDAFWVLGAITNAWNDYPSAQAALQDAVDLCRAHDMPEDEHFCLSCLAIVLLNRGDWQRAEGVAREVLDSPAAPAAGKAHAYEVLGLLELQRGAITQARPLLGEALALARKTGLAGTAMVTTVGLALCDELEGKASGRWDELVREIPDALTNGYAPGLRWGATFAARRGERELVHACADALATYAARFASAETLAALAQVLGEAALLEGEPYRAVEQFTQAIDRLAEVDAPFDRAHAQMRAGAATAVAGERELAVERLVDAYRTFRKLGAKPFWTEAAQELEALGEQVDRRLGRRAARELDGPGLTRRELEVLRLVAVGRTNREIARELFLSPRTIDMHVRHVLAKLDCRSRTEATSKAHALGLVEATSAPS
jgi:predicted ATPase/DNA-binding CsgD family transcriptional regulator